MPLLDAYLEFLCVRARPNTVAAVAYDLKVFFTLVGKPPMEVVAADVNRRHLEDFRRWLADRPGRDTTRLSAGTLAHRLGTLRIHRLLGNGYCTRPPELDCAFEAICEACTFFQTSIEFRPILQHQRDHAAEHDQTHRVDLFDRLLTRIDRHAS